MIDQQQAWDFAVQRYQQKSVADCCLELQDTHNCNVNLVLLLAYMDYQLIQLSTDLYLEFERAIEETDNAIQTHRKIRRDAKGGDESQYKALLAEELKLELLQHKALISAANEIENEQNHQQFLNANALRFYLTERVVDEQQVEHFCNIIEQS